MNRLANLDARRHQLNVVLFTKPEPNFPQKLVSTLKTREPTVYSLFT